MDCVVMENCILVAYSGDECEFYNELIINALNFHLKNDMYINKISCINQTVFFFLITLIQ